MKLPSMEKTKDILSYSSDIWAAADVLRGSVGLKNSEYPDYMMPFFALRLIESRLVRAYNEIVDEGELTEKQDIIDELNDKITFTNELILNDGVLLADIVKNDKTFIVDFDKYLQSFDNHIKGLLGIVNSDKTENLNISAIVESLKKKNVLLGYVKAWAEIDFTPFNNSEITTLEEHIKRQWADMSAETAGEQYTPFDIIELIAGLCAVDTPKENYPYKLYDMTCGGGNMLFGVEDILKKNYPYIYTETYGQELRGSLYALARIESLFRNRSDIQHGNTLSNDKFPEQLFDFGVANPPYGTDWKEIKTSIENDQTGRFGHGGYPSVSDGQLLFVQHMVAKLSDEGKAFIVLNGSPLFSGDAGSGESGIRKWLLDNDLVEAFIQLPTNEFFNTGITTYIWCINKAKAYARKDKILCINAENLYEPLKKNLGNKSRKIGEAGREQILDIFKNFSETEISKVKSKYDFYFNKQSLKKLILDDEFGAYMDGKDKTTLKNVHTITISAREQENENPDIGFNLISLDGKYKTKEEADTLNKLFKEFDNDSQVLTVIDDKGYYFLDENHCIIQNRNGENKNLGYGEIAIKAIYKKASTKAPEQVVFEILLKAVWEKDEEKVSYSPDEQENNNLINSFIKEWVTDRSDYVELLDNTVGVEVNFNNVFPKKITIRSTEEILREIKNISDAIDDMELINNTSQVRKVDLETNRLRKLGNLDTSCTQKNNKNQ